MRQRPNHKLNSWHIVQVDEEETNWRLARTQGIYHVRYYLQSYADSKRLKGRECAYWPEIHEYKRDGETMGPIVLMKPSKVDDLLVRKPFRFMWYQDSINLFETKLVGPFDFEDGFKVPQEAWRALLEEAKRVALYTGSLNRIVPLDKPDFSDKDTKDQAESYLAFRWKLIGQHD